MIEVFLASTKLVLTNLTMLKIRYVKLVLYSNIYIMNWEKILWHCGVVAIATAQLYSTKPELKICASSKPTQGVSEILDG